VDEQARRVGRNEAVFREVNEQIESLNRGLADISDGNMHIVCECGDLLCSEQIVVSIADYERIRAEPTLFFVRPGHDRPDVEVVVEENDRFSVVRKNEGGPAAVARETYARDQ
jgi:hypothetical protein